MIALQLTSAQRRAVEAPYEPCLAILGAAGTGKSTALRERAARARGFYPDAEPLSIDSPRALDEYAGELLAAQGVAVTPTDDVDAELIFAKVCEPLFALQWEEFARKQLDPEVPGLLSPARFLGSAFRLIRRLRDADVDPPLFLSAALEGAAKFYAKPPNFADPALIAATKNKYRDSLVVTSNELVRQYRREVDLAKILAKLYEAYVELIGSGRAMTGRDAIVAAARLLRGNPALAQQLRNRHRLAFVDDAQELTPAQIRLLAAIFGPALDGVTLCGDPSSVLSGERRAQPEIAFALARSKAELREVHRHAHRELSRVATPRDEAELVAQRVDDWLAQGLRPERICVLFRSVSSVGIFEEALLDRNIPLVVTGDLNIFTDRRALDALALLWNVYDPFRHDWMLRTLSNPALALCDASLAALCGEPPDPQRPLFTLSEEPSPTTRAARWNPARDLRLGWNVVRGENDDALSTDAAARIRHFRRLRDGWLETMKIADFETFARSVWREGLSREGETGSARARAQQIALQRLLTGLGEFLDRPAETALPEVLAYAQQRIESDLGAWAAFPDEGGFVALSSVEAVRGREFDNVIVARVQPGSFPRWYSPESFLFSLRYGMIPKDNVGEARATRTAKFTYYMYRAKAAQQYYQRERAAFAYAMRRARKNVLLTASGAPTRGVAAPELLEELR